MRKEKTYPNCVCHVFNRGTDKRSIFLDEKDRERFLSCLFYANSDSRAKSPSKNEEKTLVSWLSVERGEPLVEIGAFCFMDNHFHLIVREVKEGGLPKFMQKATVAYASYFNAKYERSGRLFQGPYQSKNIDSQGYMAWITAYVHANPLDLLTGDVGETASPQKKVELLAGYRWSSLQDFQGADRIEGRILSPALAEILKSCQVSLESFVAARLGLEDQVLR